MMLKKQYNSSETLIAYLEKKFIIVMIILFIFISVLTIIFNAYDIQSINNSSLKMITKTKENKTGPLISLATSTVFKKFQKAIYALMLIKRIYIHTAQIIANNPIKEDPFELDEFLYKDFLINIVELNNNYEAFSKEYNRDQQLNFLTWILDDNKIKLPLKDKNELLLSLQVKALVNAIPVMRTVFEQSLEKIEERLDNFYFVNKKSELFAGYPIQTDGQYYKSFTEKIYVDHCLNKFNAHPSYLYFPCRDWFNQIELQLILLPSQEIFISHPYLLNGAEETEVFGLSVCIGFDDPLSFTFTTLGIVDNENKFFFCVDLYYQNLVDALESINSNLNGYFFLLPIGNTNPIYFPKSNSNYFSDVTRDEFNFNQESHLSEVHNYVYDILSLINKKYDESQLILDNSKLNHYVDYKYLNNTESFKRNNHDYKFRIYPVFTYSDSDQADSLLKKSHVLNIIYVYDEKEIPQGFQTNTKHFVIQLLCYTVIYVIICLMIILLARNKLENVGQSIINPIQTIMRSFESKENTKASLDIDDSQNDDEEENRNDCSYELMDLLELVLELKEVLVITSKLKNHSQDPLLHLISAKSLYKKIKNVTRLNISNSNIGNYALHVGKYDKAFISLWKSIDFNTVETHEKYLNLTSRYPKIIQTMKKFKKAKERLKNKTSNDCIYEQDEVIDSSFGSFKNLLLKYNELAYSEEDYKRVCDSFNHLGQYYYSKLRKKLKLIAKSNQKQDLKTTDNSIFNIFKDLLWTFAEFKFMYSKFLLPKNEIEYQEIALTRVFDNYIKLNNTILYQKHLYIQGKTALICGHYNQAYKYFGQVTNRKLLLSNTHIEKKALYYLRSILKYSSHFTSKSLQPDINLIQTQIDNYSFIPRDIVIQISIANSEKFDYNRIYKNLHWINQIFEKFLSSNDRLCVVFSNHDKFQQILLPITYKDANSFLLVKNMLKELEAIVREKDKNHHCNDDSLFFINAINFSYQYVSRKSLSQRQMLLLVFTDYFDKAIIKDDEYKKGLQSVFRKIKRGINHNLLLDLIVIGSEQKLKELNNLLTTTISESSIFINYDNMHLLHKLFKRTGDSYENRSKFENEEYQCETGLGFS